MDDFLDLFVEMLTRPAFAPEDFERVRSRTLDEIRTTLRYASDEELGKAVLHTTLFAGTPYGHLPLGTVAGLEAITRDDVVAFWRERFTRDRAIVAVGGGYAPAAVRRLQEAVASLPEGDGAAAPEVPEPRLEGRHAVLVRKPGSATAISFGWPIPVHRGQREFYALQLAVSWLGEHRSSFSHLYQVIREARGLNYGDYAYVEWFPEGGRRQVPPPNVPRRRQLFEVWIRPVPDEAAHFALRAAMREVERLVRDGMSPEAFELTRTFLPRYSRHWAETTSYRLGYAIDDWIYGVLPEGHLERARRTFPDLTLEEVNAAIRRYLDPRDVLVVLVSGRADELAEALAADAPSPISYATPKPEEVLREDEEIAVHPLRIPRENVRVVPVEELFER